MAEQGTIKPAAAEPVQNTVTLDPVLMKPEAAHTSISSKDSVSDGMSPMESEKPVESEKPTETAAPPPGPPAQEYPPLRQQWIIMTAILLAIFLIALVSSPCSSHITAID